MKRVVLILFLLILFPLVSAIETEMDSEFDQAEMLFVKISGNFIEPPLKENIFFNRGHVRIPIEPFIAKIKDKYYVYAQLPEQQNNYSINFEKIKYKQGTQIIEDDLVLEFSTTSELADFSIDKGFAIVNDDFQIQLQNLQPSRVEVAIDTGTTETVLEQETDSEEEGGFFASLFGSGEEGVVVPSGKVVSLNSGESKNINFKVPEREDSFLQFISFSSSRTSYNIPVYVIANETSEPELRSFRFEFGNSTISLANNSKTKRIFYLYNNGNIDLENISLSLSDSLEDYAVLSIDSVEDLEADSSVKIEMQITSGSSGKTIEGKLRAVASKQEGYSSELSTSLDLTLNFIPGYIPNQEEEIPIDPAARTCAEMSGIFCEESEECSEEETLALDGWCCIGECSSSGNEESGLGQAIGWMILIAIVIFLFWFFFKKYKSAKGPKTILEKIKSR